MEKYESSDHAAKLNDTHPSFEFPETTGQRPESDRNRKHKSRRGHSVHHCRFEIRVRGDLEEERCIPQHQRTRCKESREREKQSRRSFLKGAGFGAASLAAAGIAGCSPSSTTTASEVPAEKRVGQHLERKLARGACPNHRGRHRRNCRLRRPRCRARLLRLRRLPSGGRIGRQGNRR